LFKQVYRLSGGNETYFGFSVIFIYQTLAFTIGKIVFLAGKKSINKRKLPICKVRNKEKNMKKLYIAVSSWGNIGKAIAKVYKKESLLPDNDMELVGIISRNPENVKDGPDGIEVVKDVGRLTVKPDIVLCAAPSGVVMNDVKKYLEQSIATVDCYDNHKEINHYRELFNTIAKRHSTVAIIGSGWDPGFNSIMRAAAGLIVSDGDIKTTFGPGRSMGHTTVVKSIHPNIREAVSLTLPGAKPGLQRREVYIELNDALSDQIEQNKIICKILEHDYFKNDDSNVFFVESIAQYDTHKHGGIITREGVNAFVETKLNGDNPIMTATAMLGSARAVGWALRRYEYGTYTMVERAPLDFVKGKNIAERLAKIKY
jgi:diaminopimelate dehydrogenase